MPFNIHEFLSAIPNELAREAHFQMSFTLPSTIKADVKQLSILCTAASLPTRQAEVASVRRYGQGITNPYVMGMNFSPLDVTFYCDAKGTTISAIQSWMDSMLNLKDSGNLMLVQYKDSYKSDISLSHFDSLGNTISQYTFIDAFPVSFGPVNFSWASHNSLVLIPASFIYTNYTSTTGSGQTISNLSTSNQPAKVTNIPVTGNVPK